MLDPAKHRERFSRLRQSFPALLRRRQGCVPIFLDGPGGTQVPQQVIDGIASYLTASNANHGGCFATSRESDAILATAHQAVADLLNAPSEDEIVFGPNMTTLTFHLSRAIGRTLRPGDEILVTRLDHDANVSPWVLAARDAGAAIRYVDIHPEDCTLDLEDLRRQLNDRTRLVACSCASNAVGTINDVRSITRWAHEAGALVFLDAVHYAPHGLIDVQEWDCDFLACSAYKFFGPHVGILWGRRKLLEELPAYKVRPAPDELPGRWMTGTQNHEGLAGTLEAVRYLAALTPASESLSNRGHIQEGMTALRAYEAHLAGLLLEALAQRPRFRVWGITDPKRLAYRVPTIAITLADCPAVEIAEHLAARQIYTWHGNMYALLLSERLGLEKQGGFLRIGLVHYNTAEEIERLVQALDEF
jgi:cysteine desulfurase family protein (TIGR01976 family)